MDTSFAPAFGVGLLALLFTGTHVGLATRGVRDRLVGRLGPVGFFGLYSVVATLTFWALVAYYAAHRFDGAPGLDLGAHPLGRGILIGVIVVGVAITVAGLVAYPRFPMALFNQSVREPYGIERISRHPFFAGTAMLGIAHALLASRLTGAVLMGALALLSIAGSRHQDAKHLRLRGRPYSDYLAVTSFVPFAAILTGRQRLAWDELPFGALAGGVFLAWVLRAAHASLFAGGGRWVVLAVAGGGAVASLQSWRRARRPSARKAIEPGAPTAARASAEPAAKSVLEVVR